jgi:hypothetical protein
MKLLEQIGSGVMKKVRLATALIGGFLALVGAGPASGHPNVVVGVRVGGPVVVRGYVKRRDRFMGRPVSLRAMGMLTTTGRARAMGMRGLAAGGTGKRKGTRADKS